MMTTEEITALLPQLAHPDPSERRSAAEGLSGADERAIYPLIKTLRDENPGVQDAAMRSLIAIGGEVTAYMALPLLREGPFLRNTARIILKQIGGPSVPLLRPLLADKDDDVRTFAVDLIAEIGVCEYPGEICRLLSTDPNQNVRASAARALGVLGYGEGLAALTDALNDNEWVAFSALESLALAGDEAAVEPVLALLGGPSETLRYAAIEALGKIGSPRSSGPLIGRLPKAGEIEKLAIIRSLVQIGMTPDMGGVADQLLAIYREGEWSDKVVALKGLADLGYAPAIPVILDTAGSLDPSAPESEECCHAVKEALAQFGCAPELLAALSDPAVRFRAKVLAAEVAGELRCAEAVPALVGLLAGDLREVRRSAVMALAAIGDDRSLAVLRTCVGDRDGHVRSAAISELGSMGDRASFDHLLDHLAVENYRDVLEDNVKALLRIDADALFSRLGGLQPAVREIVARHAVSADILLFLSREADVEIRVAALSSLGSVRDDRVQTRLAEALEDPAAEARKAAVTALAAQNCGIEGLRKALSDNDMWVRLYAVRALGGSADPEAKKTLIPRLYDADVPVVLSAIDALVQLGGGDAVALSALQNHADERVRERVAQVMEHL